jgi:hypothetical protein
MTNAVPSRNRVRASIDFIAVKQKKPPSLEGGFLI